VSSNTICAGSAVTITPSGATNYTLNTSQSGSLLVVTPGASTNYTLTGANGNCTGSTTLAIMVNSCTGLINQIEQPFAEFEIFPQPARDGFHIRTNVSETYELRLFDLNGKLVLTKKVESDQLFDTTNLEAGLYSLVINHGSMVFVQKLMLAE
jgi:hypothetical protein